MKFFLCGQCWNKYDKFVNIEDSLLFIHENVQEHVLNIMELCRMWNMITKYISLLYFFLSFLLCSW